MAIYTPGEKFRYHNILSKKKGKRDVVALLSLTAMVDMFTVLVIFLLQNYGTDTFQIPTPDNMELPKAEIIKELKPSVVISVTGQDILVNETVVTTVDQVKTQTEWMVQPIFEKTQKELEMAKDKMSKGLIKNIRTAVRPGEVDESDPGGWRKITVQADKEMDFLTLKKIMYTITEAGAGEINFAVVATKNK